MIAEAIRKSGRPIVLSLSPGPTNLKHSAEIVKYAQMTRIADDIWDGWNFPNLRGPNNGLLSAFDNLAEWAPYAKPGFWPDADMLPWGSLRPSPGSGAPRQSRLTQDEQRTQFTLWAIARSPLILGTNLTELDSFTRSLISEKEIIDLNQNATESHPIVTEALDGKSVRVWVATAVQGHKSKHYLAIFNLANSMTQFHAKWEDLNLPQNTHVVFDVWANKTFSDEPRGVDLSVSISAHGCALLRLD